MKKRIYYHEKIAKLNKHYNKFLQNKILKIIKEGNSIVVCKILNNVSEDLAFTKEKELIAYYKSIGIKLCNLTKCGEGNGGFKSEETKKRMSDSHKKIKFSKEWIENIKKSHIESLYKPKYSEETKLKMSKSHCHGKFSFSKYD